MSFGEFESLGLGNENFGGGIEIETEIETETGFGFEIEVCAGTDRNVEIGSRLGGTIGTLSLKIFDKSNRHFELSFDWSQV